jgi:hypothetical protein
MDEVKGLRGFLLSYSAILLASVLLLFTVFYMVRAGLEEKDLVTITSLEKAAFVMDNIMYDYNRIFGASVQVIRGPATTTISISDRLPGLFSKTETSKLDSFFSGDYATKHNITLSVDSSTQRDGRTELIFSNGLEYDYNYGSDNIVKLYAPSGDTNFTAITITIYSSENLDSNTPWSWDPTGDLTVTINYSDAGNNTISESGKINSTTLHTWTFNYGAEGSLVLKAGRIGTYNGAVEFEEHLTQSYSYATITISATFASPSTEIKYHYPMSISYTQAKVSISRNLILGRS